MEGCNEENVSVHHTIRSNVDDTPYCNSVVKLCSETLGLLLHRPTVLLKHEQTQGRCNLLVFYSGIQTYQCDFQLCLPEWMCQNETGDRPGSMPLKVQSANQRRGSRGRRKHPVLSAAPERGRREDMEIHIAAVFIIFKPLIYHLMGTNTSN